MTLYYLFIIHLFPCSQVFIIAIAGKMQMILACLSNNQNTETSR